MQVRVRRRCGWPLGPWSYHAGYYLCLGQSVIELCGNLEELKFCKVRYVAKTYLTKSTMTGFRTLSEPQSRLRNCIAHTQVYSDLFWQLGFPVVIPMVLNICEELPAQDPRRDLLRKLKMSKHYLHFKWIAFVKKTYNESGKTKTKSCTIDYEVHLMTPLCAASKGNILGNIFKMLPDFMTM